MASDRVQNRYSHFVPLETLLRFENCSSSHCLLSSWRRFHFFESSHPSFHRTVFWGALLAFLRGVSTGLCHRCVIYMSSCRRVFLSSTALHNWVGTWCMGTYTVYRRYLHLVTLLPCYPCYSVTLLPYCSIPLLLSPSVTLLPCYPFPLFPCYSVVNFLISVYFCMTNHKFFPV